MRKAWRAPAQPGARPWQVWGLVRRQRARPNPPLTWRLSPFQPGASSLYLLRLLYLLSAFNQVLFLYVGMTELSRLLFQPYTPYLPGDGHDVVWPKVS